MRSALYACGDRDLNYALLVPAFAPYVSSGRVSLLMTEYVNTRLEIGPNASMSWPQAKWVIAGMVLVSSSIGGFFAVFGLWPILPFCGLEVAAFAAALVASVHRNGYRELVCFDGDVIQVEFGMAQRAAAARVTLQRAQTRVFLEPGPYRNSPTSLILSCCGQRVEIARCVTDEERLALCQRIRQLIHPGWVMPVPAAAEAVSQWGCD